MTAAVVPWVPLGLDGRGPWMPTDSVVVWVWRSKTAGRPGYWVLGRCWSGHERPWRNPGGTPLSWVPTHWQPLTEPAGEPEEVGS